MGDKDNIYWCFGKVYQLGLFNHVAAESKIVPKTVAIVE